MTPTILSIILTTTLGGTLGGTGAVALKYYLDRRNAQEQEDQVPATPPNSPVTPIGVTYNLDNIIGNIVEEHIQRNSEDSDTEIKINIHTHHKEK